MAETNPDTWAPRHMRRRALSRWDGEGGASASRPTAHDAAWTALRVGIAADHGGFALKTELVRSLRMGGCHVVDFGARQFDPDDDYPDLVAPLARAIATGELLRGIALSGSGVGVSIAANKFAGVRAALVHDVFSAHQGVADDDMNVACLGGAVVGPGLALDLVHVFLNARFSGGERHHRRLTKLRAIEHANPET